MTAFNNLICSHTLHGIAIGPHGTATLKGNTISQNKGDGIWCGGKTKYKEISTSKTMVTAVDNIIVQNGLSGICLEGGCFSLKSNTISDNWAWGIFIQDRSSVLAEGNDISCNKCGGIRVGMNYSASVILDGNTIKDHSGPAILAFNDDTSYDEKATDFDEVKVYSNQPIITDRNVRLYNDKPIQSPRNTVKSLKTCCGCQKMSTSLKACVKCRIASYCSRECQKSHWKRHQNMCPLLSEKYTIEIQMKDTQPVIPESNTVGLIYARTFHPSLKGIREGPSPDVKSRKRFIVKIQSDHSYVPYNPKKSLTLYDQSVTLDIKLRHPELYHLCSECGRLSGDKITSKKIFCWASYKNGGDILCVHTDEFPVFQTW